MKPAMNWQMDAWEFWSLRSEHKDPASFDFKLLSLIVRIRQEQTEIKRLRALLKVARCPDTDCVDGVIAYGPDPDDNWEPQQCQWCCERGYKDNPPEEE